MTSVPPPRPFPVRSEGSECHALCVTARNQKPRVTRVSPARRATAVSRENEQTGRGCPRTPAAWFRQMHAGPRAPSLGRVPRSSRAWEPGSGAGRGSLTEPHATFARYSFGQIWWKHERREPGRRPRGLGHHDGRGAVSAPPHRLRVPFRKMSQRFRCVLCNPFPPDVPGGLALSPASLQPWQCQAGTPLGRPGQCLLMPRGPRRMDTGVSTPLVPSCPAW